MSKDLDFVEPDVAETVPVDTVLERLPISSENRKWLSGLFSQEAVIEEPEDFKRAFRYLFKCINKENTGAFKPLFLFNSIIKKYLYYFDKDRLSSERKKILPELFTENGDGKPQIFKPYVANILDYIWDCAEEDTSFAEAYQQKKREIRANSSSNERIEYCAQQDVGAAYGEAQRDIDDEEDSHIPGRTSFLDPFYNTSELKPYPVELVSELEDLPRESRLILDRIFEGVNPEDIPYIFFEHIQFLHPQNNIAQDGYIDHMELFLYILAYLERVFIHKNRDLTDFDRGGFFLDYLEDLSLSALENKLALFQEMSFLKTRHNGHNRPYKNIKDVLDSSVAFESASDKWRSQEWQERANTLSNEFINVIAKGAAAYPIKSFLSLKDGQSTLPADLNEYELAILKAYCEIVASKNNYEDALFLAQFWFSKFRCQGPSYFSSEALFEFIKNEAFFYEKVFLRFINNEDFVFRFLSIPQDAGGESHSVGQYWVEYYLACWIGHKNNLAENVFDAAFQELKNKSFVFPRQMSELIQANKTFDRLLKEKYHFSHSNDLNKGVRESELDQSNRRPDILLIEKYHFSHSNDLNKKASLFLCGLCAALDDVRYDSILENTKSTTKEQFLLYLIRYRYTYHKEIVPQEFLDFLFGLKNPNRTNKEDEFYPLELVREACRNGVLTKQTVLERVSEYIGKYRKTLIKSVAGIEDRLDGLISYFEAHSALFMQFYERAVQEDDETYTELSVFLRFCSYLPYEKRGAMLENHTENINIRCSKMLNALKGYVERNEFPVDEQIFYEDYIDPACQFTWSENRNFWKTLKPLLMAFRASKKPLLDGSLNRFSRLPYFIDSFFGLGDDETLKELRYDMANDFIEYLKPLKPEKEKRQATHYTPIEREAEGFDTSFTEPSPYWRYAYIRALGDLSVRNDKRGHPFYPILTKIFQGDPNIKAERDPSEKVRKAAEKVSKKLNAIRKGYSGNNHKKCLFEAFWWLRQAHMLSLGEKVDSKEALELRIKEWKER